MDSFFKPAFQDAVRIGKAGLPGGKNSAAAGFCDNVQSETILIHPEIHILDFFIQGIAVGNTEGPQDSKVILIVQIGLFFCLADCGDILLRPGKPDFFYVCHGRAAFGNTVFN